MKFGAQGGREIRSLTGVIATASMRGGSLSAPGSSFQELLQGVHQDQRGVSEHIQSKLHVCMKATLHSTRWHASTTTLCMHQLPYCATVYMHQRTCRVVCICWGPMTAYKCINYSYCARPALTSSTPSLLTQLFPCAPSPPALPR